MARVTSAPFSRGRLRVSVAQDKLSILSNTHSCLRAFDYPGRLNITAKTGKQVGFRETSEALYSRA
jgi:hypothetical protein